MKHTGALFPLLLVGTLAGLSFWLERVTQPQGIDKSGKYRHDPDYIVEGLTVRRFDTTGTLQHTLTAKSMAHFPDDDSTTAFAPHAVFHRQPPATLTADTAWISKDGKEVRLDDNVRMTRAGTPETVVTTTRLFIQPDDETAHSNAPVTITQGRSIVNGTGLTADNKIQTVTLLGPVRGTIHRNTEQKP